MTGILSWSLRLTARDFRSRENWMLIAVMLLTVTAVSSVGFLTSRVEKLMVAKSHEVLAADVRLESGRFNAVNAYLPLSQGLHIATVQTVSLNSVIHYGPRWHLVNLLAVEPGYPLRGELKISATPYGASERAQQLPRPGEVWLDPRLMIDGDLKLNDRVHLGSEDLIVTQVLAARPDQGSGMTELAPTALVNMATLPTLHLLTPSSRLTSATLFSGQPAALAKLVQEIKQRKSAAEKLVTIDESNQRLGQSLARARHFFNLTTLITLLLCVVCLALTTRRYLYRHWEQVALMKCLGMTRRRVGQLILSQLMLLASAIGLLGVACGWGLSLWLGEWLAQQFKVVLPWPDWTPAGVALGSLGCMLLGFSYPTLGALVEVPVMRILRRDVQLNHPKLVSVVGLGLLSVIALLILLLSDVRLILYTSGGLLVAAVGFYLIAWGVLGACRPLALKATGVYRLVATRLVRRRHVAALEVAAVALSLAGLCLLTLTRADVLTQWQQSLPANTPNMFMINIPTDSHLAFQTALADLSHSEPTLMPWIRGRLVAVNHGQVQEQANQAKISGLAEREQNISIASQLPADNRVVAGQFWRNTPTTPEVSVASEFAQSLGLKVGDQLTFDLAGTPLEATLTSIRQVRWDGFKPNFFLLLSPHAADESIGSYMTSVYLADSARNQLEPFIRQFPSVTVFDVQAILSQIRELVERAVTAVEWTFIFTVLAGLLVLLTMIQATLDERHYESAVLRTLGVTPPQLWRASVLEFAFIGLLSAALALGLAVGLSAYVSSKIFDFAWRFRPLSYVALGSIATLIILSIGVVATLNVTRQAPLEGLKDASAV
jgi:putative ABC transport system permease protein